MKRASVLHAGAVATLLLAPPGLAERPTNAAVALPPVEIFVTETITVTDSPRVVPPAVITVTETIAVTDASRVVPPAVIEVSENVAVADAPSTGVFDFEFPVNATGDADDGVCDAGHCSLREAINAANTSSLDGPTIGFVLTGSAPHVIQPSSSLPAITRTLTIDGYTQTGASPARSDTPADLQVILDGTHAPDAVGLQVSALGVTIRGLGVRGFSQGVGLQGRLARLSGNHLWDNTGDGVFVTGTDNIIGGTDPAERNVIHSNHTGIAIFAEGDRNFVRGNFVGFDPLGAQLRPNALDGIAVGGDDNRIGGSGPSEGNRIAPHPSNAVLVGPFEDGGASPRDNVIRGNRIGTADSGEIPLAAGYGVSLDGAVRTRIGGSGNAANIIRGHAFHGILVAKPGAVGNRIVGNEITGNGGLGINLTSPPGPAGAFVTANDDLDADTGPNGLQNFPVITSSSEDLGTVRGRLSTLPNGSFTIDLYANTTCDAFGYGEGERLLTSFEVGTGSGGTADFSVPVPTGLGATDYLTATATGDEGTSEFGRCFPAGLTLPSIDVLSVTTEPVLVSPTGDPGFILEAAPDAGDGSTSLTVCGVVPLRMTSGDRLAVGCGSAALAVEAGAVEVELGGELLASVPSGGRATVDREADETLTVTNDGSEPVTLTSGGTELGPIDSGGAVVLGEIEVADGRRIITPPNGRDKFMLEGTVRPGGVSQGFDPSAESVSLVFGPFRQTIPAGDFRRVARGRQGGEAYLYTGRDGITLMKIESDGGFSVVASRVALDSTDPAAPVSFALAVGDDAAATRLEFDGRGKLKDGAAGVVAEEEDRVATPGADRPVLAWPDSASVVPGASGHFALLTGEAGPSGGGAGLSCERPPIGVSCSFERLGPDVADGDQVYLLTARVRGPALQGDVGSGRPGGLLIVMLLLAGVVLVPLLLPVGERWRRPVSIGLGGAGTLLLLLQVACSEGPTEPMTVPEFAAEGTYRFEVVSEGPDTSYSTELVLVIEERR